MLNTTAKDSILEQKKNENENKITQIYYQLKDNGLKKEENWVDTHVKIGILNHSRARCIS